MSPTAIGIVLREVIARNRIRYGIVYLQVSRGVARRDHAFPAPEVPPSLVVTARPLNARRNEALAGGRYRRDQRAGQPLGPCRHQDHGLLPNVLARQAAIEQGARDAWFVDKDGTVTEAASANAWIVTEAGNVVTRPADHGILQGYYPHRAIRRYQGAGTYRRGAAFTLSEAYAAREAFVTRRARSCCRWCASTAMSSARASPGPWRSQLRRAFHQLAEWV